MPLAAEVDDARQHVQPLLQVEPDEDTPPELHVVDTTQDVAGLGQAAWLLDRLLQRVLALEHLQLGDDERRTPPPSCGERRTFPGPATGPRRRDGSPGGQPERRGRQEGRERQDRRPGPDDVESLRALDLRLPIRGRRARLPLQRGAVDRNGADDPEPDPREEGRHARAAEPEARCGAIEGRQGEAQESRRREDGGDQHSQPQDQGLAELKLCPVVERLRGRPQPVVDHELHAGQQAGEEYSRQVEGGRGRHRLVPFHSVVSWPFIVLSLAIFR